MGLITIGKWCKYAILNPSINAVSPALEIQLSLDSNELYNILNILSSFQELFSSKKSEHISSGSYFFNL